MNKPLQKLGLLFLASGLWLGSGINALGQVLSENVEYAPGSALVGQGGWGITGTTATNPITVSAQSLGYPKLIGSNVGGAIAMQATGQDASKAIGESYNSGSVYVSFLVNLSNVQADGDYFFHLSPNANTNNSTFVGRVFAKRNANGKVQFGVSKVSTPAAVYATEEFELNTTHLVVLKYTFVEGATNDAVELFVNPALGEAEPVTPLVDAEAGGADPSAIAAINLRQGGNSAAPSLLIDAIKVGRSWSDITTSDVTAPTVVSVSPERGSTGVANSTDIELVFSETVAAGVGAIDLYAGDTKYKSIAINDPSVTFSDKTVTIKNVVLETNTTYRIEIANTAIKDAAGNNFAGVSGTTWTFTTAAAATPVITASVNQIEYPFTSINKPSLIQSYTISGADLKGNVTVAVTGPFQISKTDGAYGTEALNFTQVELAANPRIFVRFVPTAAGSATGAITHTSTDAQQVVVNLSGTGINPYAQDFNDPAFLTNSGWSQYSVAGAQVWASTNFGRDCLTGCNASTPNKAVQINGFSGGNVVNEDWLISPAMDLASFTNTPVLQFYSISAFAGNQLQLKYSIDYTGTGNPNAATWSDLNANFPASNSSVWTLSQGIELPKAAKVYVAFVYTSTSEAASRWTVDDFKVEDLRSFYTIPTLSMNFGEVAQGTTSTGQKFTFRAVGYGNVTLTAPTGYQLSANNGATYTNQVTISEAEASAAAGREVLVRFAPTTKSLRLDGQITFAGTGLNATGINVTGSSYPKSETFDVATYNIEFFASDVKDGNSEFGPVDDPLQIQNITTVLKTVGADVYGIEELSEEAALDQVIAQMPGYAKAISTRYSYSFEPADPTFPAQKIGFIYNTATMKLVNTRVMFEKFFDDIRSGAANIADYPGGSASSFWSSGRLPFMATFDVTFNNVTRRVRIIDIHAKSGSAAADFNRRKFDVQVLKDSLDRYYPEDNIILVGDFNDNVSGSINSGGVSSYKSFVDDVANYNALTLPLSQAGAYSFPSSNSFLDHIIISKELESSYIPNSITVEDPRNYITNYSNTTSDHLPVYARFNISSQTPLAVRDEFSGNFNLYPNPTTGKVALRLPEEFAKQSKINLTVYSMRGEVVMQAVGAEQALNAKLSNQIQAASAGMYLVKIQVGDKIYMTRIVKQ